MRRASAGEFRALIELVTDLLTATRQTNAYLERLMATESRGNVVAAETNRLIKQLLDRFPIRAEPAEESEPQVELISREEAAKRLGVGVHTVKWWSRETDFPAFRVLPSPRGKILVKWHEVPAWLEKRGGRLPGSPDKA
jgi:hypothetical protein